MFVLLGSMARYKVNDGLWVHFMKIHSFTHKTMYWNKNTMTYFAAIFYWSSNDQGEKITHHTHTYTFDGVEELWKRIRTGAERNGKGRMKHQAQAHIMLMWLSCNILLTSFILLPTCFAHSLSGFTYINQMINLTAVMYDGIKSHSELSERTHIHMHVYSPFAVGGKKKGEKNSQPIGWSGWSVEYNIKHTFAL